MFAEYQFSIDWCMVIQGLRRGKLASVCGNRQLSRDWESLCRKI